MRVPNLDLMIEEEEKKNSSECIEDYIIPIDEDHLDQIQKYIDEAARQVSQSMPTLIWKVTDNSTQSWTQNIPSSLDAPRVSTTLQAPTLNHSSSKIYYG